jgi:predicted phosphodiesterase
MVAIEVKSEIKIAIVGDVHDQWSPIEGDLLRGLGVDLVLFVGDFGNEAVKLVEQIAQLDLPKAIIFGNHDAWFSATHYGIVLTIATRRIGCSGRLMRWVRILWVIERRIFWIWV